MKYGLKEISDLDDWELTTANDRCNYAIKNREEASKHIKFNKDHTVGDKSRKKMNFPPINPQFTAMKNEIELEMKKRKL